MDSFNSKKPIPTSIQELLDSTTPVREAFHLHGCSYRGYFPSNKGVHGLPISFESGLAHDALRLFELAPEVTLVVPEPGCLHYRLNGKASSYTPDYLLHLRDGSRAIVEIKYAIEAERPANQARFQRIGQLAEQAKALFAVLTERQLRPPILQRNLSLLESHRHLPVSRQAQERLFHRLRTAEATLGSLAIELGRGTVLAAIAQGVITTNFRSNPITDRSLIRRV